MTPKPTDEAALPPVPCSALDMAAAAWEKKQKSVSKSAWPVELAAVIHGNSADDIADQLEYIAMRMRENGMERRDGRRIRPVRRMGNV